MELRVGRLYSTLRHERHIIDTLSLSHALNVTRHIFRKKYKSYYVAIHGLEPARNLTSCYLLIFSRSCHIPVQYTAVQRRGYQIDIPRLYHGLLLHTFTWGNHR